jgi:hypothetical protein
MAGTHTTTRVADELYVELYEHRGRALVAKMDQLASEAESRAATRSASNKRTANTPH